MFAFIPLAPLVGALEAERQARASRAAHDHAADAACYMAAAWRRADPDVIDVEAREVPEPRLLEHAEAAPK